MRVLREWRCGGIAEARVADEKVTVTVAVELRGEAPGTREGGVVEHVNHEVDIECAVNALPEKIVVSVNELHMGDSISAGALELPDGASLKSAADAIVVQVVEPAAEVEEAEVPDAEGAEPEVIGAKPEEEEGGE